ncbi:MAG TPA: hypothetical protein VJB41_03315 [Patescibacteria group bacterium]|nr:hypothetical protein [Patescibacteria group bacterium]
MFLRISCCHCEECNDNGATKQSPNYLVEEGDRHAPTKGSGLAMTYCLAILEEDKGGFSSWVANINKTERKLPMKPTNDGFVPISTLCIGLGPETIAEAKEKKRKKKEKGDDRKVWEPIGPSGFGC